MCTVCGCGSGEIRYDGQPKASPAPKAAPTRAFRPVSHSHEHVHADGTVHSHDHHHHGDHDHAHQGGHDHEHPEKHAHVHEADGALHYGHGPAHAHAPGLTQSQMVKIEQNILGKNDQIAHRNRAWLAERGVLALNLVSSPGSGKTTLLVRTIEALKAQVPVAVVEGDQQTSFDAERIRATGAPALQINTGKGCHLDAHMVGQALERLPIPHNSLLLVENVGNLVCPAAFDLGEAHKVVILSVTEGEDKPLKYPDMFAAADVMLLSKVDLLPHLSFDADKAVEYARRVNPQLTVFRLSSTSGEGFDAWLDWIRTGLAARAAGGAAAC